MEGEKPRRAKVTKKKIDLRPKREPSQGLPPKKRPKVLKKPLLDEPTRNTGISLVMTAGFLVMMKSLMFHNNGDQTLPRLMGKAILTCLLIWLTISLLITNRFLIYHQQPFLHLINLPFHEAGHIFFMPFGSFMTYLGGSLLQVLIPFLCLGTFLLKQRDPYAGSVALWWAGESLYDLVPYIDDARRQKLMLLGGFTGRENPDSHDWFNILKDIGLLQYEHTIANMAAFCGAMMMLAGIVWGGLWILSAYGIVSQR